MCLVLALLPQIVYYAGKALAYVISGPDQVFRGTPRSHWTGTPSSEIRLPQGKSVGGPLVWDSTTVHDLRVALRNRYTVEKTYNGVTFVDMVPPGSHIDLIMRSGIQTEAYLVSKNRNNFLTDEDLRTAQEARHKKSGTVFPLPGFNTPSQVQEIRYENYSGRSAEGGFKLNEMYIQCISGEPADVEIERTEQKGTFQYVLEVTGEETTITLPNTAWKQFWIAPVDDPCYKSRFIDTTVPATGLSLDEATNAILAASPEVREKVKLEGDGYRQDIRFQSVLITKNGESEPSILHEAMLVQPSEMTNKTVRIRLNVPQNKEFSRFVTPARIIVGIKTK